MVGGVGLRALPERLRVNLDTAYSLKRGIAFELLRARELSLQGWPADAMHHRRVALKAIRILRRHEQFTQGREMR